MAKDATKKLFSARIKKCETMEPVLSFGNYVEKEYV